MVEAIFIYALAPHGGQDFGSLSLLSLIRFYVSVVVGSLMHRLRGGGGGVGSVLLYAFINSLVRCLHDGGGGFSSLVSCGSLSLLSSV